MEKTKISIVISALVLTSMLSVLLITETPAVTSQEPPPYLDPTLPPENRALDLLSRMTLDEKVGQMTQIAPVYLLQDSDIVTYNLGSFIGGEDTDAAKAQLVWNGVPNTPLNWAKMYNYWQQIAFENTRLGIPLIWGLDAAHGQSAVLGAVIFPHHVGMGSTWNPDLVEEAGHVTAVEVKATGPHWNFFPNIDVARDDRWGRTYETFSEDPYLAGVLGAHELNGNQGTDLTDNYTIAACGKHYLGSGGTTDGVDQGDCVADDRIVREVHLEPFIYAVKGGAQAVMASFCSVNGEKVHGSTYWLTDVLKEEQGLENQGFILSDWAAIDQVDPSYATAVEKCINAGIDMNMVPQNYATFQQTMKDLIADNKISMSRVDNAVYRILINKFRLGLFENPYVEENATWVVGCDNHREVARRAVQESTVLLKNDNVLPISKSSSIFVAGPNANNMANQCGGWTTKWQGPYPETPPPGTTILQAIQNTTTGTVTFSEDGSGAAGHDVAIVVVGEEPYAEMLGDVTNLDLPSDQLSIIDTVVNSGVPTVVIMVAGRPRTGIESRLPNWKGFLMAWLPGTEGQGVADVLFGDYNPSGKLSRSWPKTTAQEPINYDRRPGENYDPLYEFGYGLSCTTFTYSNLSVTPDNNLSVNDNITVSVYVANTGARSGSEVVQVYVNDVESTLSTPVKKLYRFKKITLAPNDNNNVSFTIPVAELGYYLDNTNERTVENGIFNVMVGGLSENIEVTSGGTVIPPVQTFTPSSLPTPTSPPASVGPGSGTGLTAEYWTSTRTVKFDTLKCTVVDNVIDFDPFDARLKELTGNKDLCAVRWTGWVEPRHSESYTFYTRTDDGVRLWVDGKLIIDRWVDQGASEYWNSVTLTAGTKYAIKMEYYEYRVGAVAQLSWSSLSTSKEIIPQTQLYEENMGP
ncbi:MAG: glycoside hydrolase family 3 C-terminal domain-containing protein [Candidatus Bathyarchaeota archaeon]|nr:glycoside hydrolase family 3 C-terminal domain-containing protein [Candidatus Bathyarchaeota archaeon]